MKKRLYVTGILITFLISGTQLVSSPTGAPQPASGGIAEGGATCFQGGCHVGSPAAAANILSTDIPATGYTPLTTYTITVTLAGIGNKGFQVSPQKSDGSAIGTLTAGTSTWIPFNNYITHTLAKSSSTATWHFSWKAPAAGNGDVTFFGAFAITRGTTKTQALTISEAVQTGIAEEAFTASLGVFPNPVSSRMFISFDLPRPLPVRMQLTALNGQACRTLETEPSSAGRQLMEAELDGLERGIYILELKAGDFTAYRKIVLSQ